LLLYEIKHYYAFLGAEISYRVQSRDMLINQLQLISNWYPREF